MSSQDIRDPPDARSRNEKTTCSIKCCHNVYFYICCYIPVQLDFRLQLKYGLFLVRNHPKLNEMVSDRSSRAENWTDIRKISMRVSFDSKKCEKVIIL